MAACNSGVDLTDLAIGHQLRLFQSALDGIDCRLDIDDHPFAHALGFMLSQTKHFKPAFRQHFGHHRNHFAGADVQCNDQVFDVTSHMFFTSQG